MLNYMVPGYDMFKVLCYSCLDAYNSDSNHTDLIIDLFQFYGKNDPYFIYEKRVKGVFKSVDEYCKRVTNSYASTYTPLMFFNWIYDKYGNSELISRTITRKNRNNLYQLQYNRCKLTVEPDC
jgi:hypothetical protein